MSWVSWLIVIYIVIFLVWAIGVFNSLVQRKNRVKEAWSDIDVQLKRRYDLVPNLVEAVKGYKEHEASVLESVTKARVSAMQASNTGDVMKIAQAEGMLSGALKGLFAVVENYPQLKASENFLELQKELAGLENAIQSARMYYNASVREFNNTLQVFPNNFIGTAFNFKQVKFFGADDAEKQAVKVSF